MAVTQTRIAWAAYANGTLRGVVKISDVGATAGIVTTVTIPGPVPTITSLAADLFGERFFVTTGYGDIFSISSDGATVTKVFDRETNPTVRNIVADVYWGSWYDSYNSNFYFCPWSGLSGKKQVMKASVSGSTMSLPTAMVDGSSAEIQVTDCDGMGVNPFTQEVFALKSSDPYNWSRITADGVKTDVTNFKDVNNTDISRFDTAPSSLFISHSTSKMYFSTETSIYETGFDGNGTRVLYTGSDLQNIAVYFGATVSTIDEVAQSYRPGGGSSGSGSTGSGELANTGVSSSLLLASGAIGASLMFLGGLTLAARRIAKN